MIVSRDQIAALNFGYLNGSDLLQFCPDQMLIKAYAVDPNKFQTGCNQAYSYVKAKLCNRYDINSVLSNANQLFLRQSQSFTVSIAPGTYISRIDFESYTPRFNSAPLTGYPSGIFPIADVYPVVNIGTTLGGDEIMKQTNIGNGTVWVANKYFASQTTLYVTLAGSETTVNITATTGVQMPPVYPLSCLNQASDFNIFMRANTYVYQIFGKILLDNPSVKIGTTDGGEEIYPNVLVSDSGLTVLVLQYFPVDTILYFKITNGSVNFRIDEGLKFVAPQPNLYAIKDDLLTEILAIRAIKSILGSNSGTDKQLESIIEENEHIISQLQNEQMGLSLPAAPNTISAIPYTVNSSFKTIG